MSAEAVVPGWMGYRFEVRDDLPAELWCLISGGTLYVARWRLSVFRDALRGMLAPADETRMAPDLDTPRDAAPEGWR